MFQKPSCVSEDLDSHVNRVKYFYPCSLFNFENSLAKYICILQN